MYLYMNMFMYLYYADQDEVEPSTSATRQEDSTAETTEPVRELSECDRQGNVFNYPLSDSVVLFSFDRVEQL